MAWNSGEGWLLLPLIHRGKTCQIRTKKLKSRFNDEFEKT